jgi:heme/copper-type cytochrome/quinol oxidase subunit 1
LSIAAVYATIIGIYHWWPIFAGVAFDNEYIEFTFWSFFCGVNLTFFPLHQARLARIPRRYTSIHDELSYLNYLSTFGTILSIGSIATFFTSIWESSVVVLADDFGIDEINHIEWRYYPVPIHTAIEGPFIL